MTKHIALGESQTSEPAHGSHTKYLLILKAPITTGADDNFCDIFSNFSKKKGMIFHENRLLADDSHEISCLIVIFKKVAKFKIVVCCNL